jgi:putative tricarboxylic transport membrane protein
MPEAFSLMAERRDGDQIQRVELKRTPGNDLPLVDCVKLLPSFLRGTVIGTIVGAIPGPGAAVSSIVAYNEEKRWSKTPEKFGTGLDEGVAAPEAANNAVVAGSLVPTLALGVPGSGAIAVLLGLLVSKGVVPGPMLFSQGDALVMAIFFGLVACNVIILILGLVSIPALAAIAAIPRHVLAPSC